MSQANVDLVRALQPPPGTDIVEVFREGFAESPVLEALAPVFHPDCEVLGRTPIEDARGIGIEGLGIVWRQWLEPWASYRTEIEDVVAVNADTVLVLTRDYGRRDGMEAEVRVEAAAVWRVRDGRVARIEFFPDRREALESVGLEDG